MELASHQDVTEPTLRDILTAITTCNSLIAALTGEVKGMKMEISLVRQNVQKLRGCTSALEGDLCTLKDDWQPLHVANVSL